MPTGLDWGDAEHLPPEQREVYLRGALAAIEAVRATPRAYSKAQTIAAVLIRIEVRARELKGGK